MAPPRSRPERSKPWWRSATRADSARRRAANTPAARRNLAAERAMVAHAQKGGPRQREELIRTFMPMITGVAHAYWWTGTVEREELIQAGVVGLLRALERYDPSRGVPFWGYAAWWVRQAMQQVVSELSRPIVLSDRALRQLARVKDAQRRLEQTRARQATWAEVAEITGLPATQVESLISAERRPRPLDEPANEESGGSTTVGDLLADPHAEDSYERVPHRVLADQLPRLLEYLSDRERTVICCRYGIGRREHTLREVAERLAVSAERVRQIEEASLQKLHAAAAGA
jgi:RNA polymerase sigma factor (sigma-70 family)